VQKNTALSFAVFMVALSAAGYSCSPASEPPGFGLGATTGAGAGGKGGTGGNTGNMGGAPVTGGSSTGGSIATGGSAAGGTGPVINPDASVDDGSTQIDEDAACGTGEASATLKPVNMFVMFDRSWSMNECGDGNTAPPSMGGVQSLDCPTLSRWDLTSVALTQFVQSPEAADISIALRFFPDDNPAPGCTGYATMGGFMGGGVDAGTIPELNCDIPACAEPLVNIAPLLVEPAPTDAHEAALVAAIVAATPPGPEMPNPNPGTPTYAALGGAEQWATAYQMAHPEQQTVVVLITDGEPYGCDTNTQNIARLASDALNAGVLTYVVGLTGASEAQLDQLAAAGGTDEAYFVSDGNTATAELLAALIAIKGEALSCDFDVPTQDSSGQEIDPKLVNVNYQSGEAGMVTEFGIVDSLDACGTALGWYYDNPAMPTHIYLCPSACEAVTKDTMARLQVLAGCKPKVVTK
jgi:hypothetical protein